SRLYLSASHIKPFAAARQGSYKVARITANPTREKNQAVVCSSIFTATAVTRSTKLVITTGSHRLIIKKNGPSGLNG
ncbi:256_t:CDS:1, partial [Acaulospora colombiana]